MEKPLASIGISYHFGTGGRQAGLTSWKIIPSPLLSSSPPPLPPLSPSPLRRQTYSPKINDLVDKMINNTKQNNIKNIFIQGNFLNSWSPSPAPRMCLLRRRTCWWVQATVSGQTTLHQPNIWCWKPLEKGGKGRRLECHTLKGKNKNLSITEKKIVCSTTDCCRLHAIERKKQKKADDLEARWDM